MAHTFLPEAPTVENPEDPARTAIRLEHVSDEDHHRPSGEDN